MGMVETYLYRGLAKEMVMAGRGGQFLVPHTGSNFTLFTAVTVSIVVFVCYIFMDGTDLVHMAKDANTTGDIILQKMQNTLDH
jgi:hypothetical protein